MPLKLTLAPARLLTTCALMLALAGLVWSGSAHAGTYQVTACQAASAASNVNNAFEKVSTDLTLFPQYQACPSGNGMYVRNTTLSSTHYAAGSAAAWRFTAPAGTTVSALAFTGFWSTTNANQTGFQAVLSSSDRPFIHGCQATTSGSCSSGSAFSGTVTGLNAAWVQAGVACTLPAGCTTPATSSGSPSAEIGVRSATVTISDTTNPTETSGRGALWTDPAGTWETGTRALGFDAQDGAGLVSTSVMTQSQSTGDVKLLAGGDYHAMCDYTRPAPCPTSRSLDTTIDTKSLPDGRYSLGLYAKDTAGNLGAVARTVLVDNTPPHAATGLAVTGGEGWRSANSFDMTFGHAAADDAQITAGNGSPVAAAYYQLCDTTQTCQTPVRVASTGITALHNIAVPGPGAWSARVWLQDLAGNIDPTAASTPVQLRYDLAVPAAPVLEQRAGWQGATGLTTPLALSAGGSSLSGLTGFICTTDGSDPSTDPAAMNVPATNGGGGLPVGGLAAGTITVRCRAVSGAGVVSSAVSQSVLRIDLTAPTATVSGAPDPAVWQTQPVSLTATGSDPGSESGVASITYTVDNQPPVTVPGTSAQIAISAEGAHQVSVVAVDNAGNRSPARTVDLRVDRTGPSGLFKPRSPSDPREIRVPVADAGSGIAAGQVQLLANGTWTTLPTTTSGGELVAHLADESLATGSYALRALVVDRAGNWSTLTRTADGAAAKVELPVRLAATLRLSAATARVRRCRVTRARGHIRRTCRLVTVPGRAGVTRLTYAKRTRLVGLLETSGPQPLANATLDVSEQVRGHAPRELDGVRTGHDGSFALNVTAGPSRTITLSYAGSNTVRPATASRQVVVTAPVRLSASTRRVHPGGKVTLTTSLPGDFVPANGVAVELRFRFRFHRQSRFGSWATFATGRTDTHGHLTRRIPIQPDPRAREYEFQARVIATNGWPYQPLPSRPVNLTVG